MYIPVGVSKIVWFKVYTPGGASPIEKNLVYTPLGGSQVTFYQGLQCSPVTFSQGLHNFWWFGSRQWLYLHT